LPATRISPLNDFTQNGSLQPGCGVDLGHDVREVRGAAFADSFRYLALILNRRTANCNFSRRLELEPLGIA
jgi:hypothetical protein